MRALFPRVVFATRHAHAVIGPDENDGVFPEPIFLQLSNHLTGLVVDLSDRVVVTRPGFAKFGHIGMVRRNRRLGRVMKIFSLEPIQSLADDHIFGDLRDARMTGTVVENRKERLL